MVNDIIKRTPETPEHYLTGDDIDNLDVNDPRIEDFTSDSRLEPCTMVCAVCGRLGDGRGQDPENPLNPSHVTHKLIPDGTGHGAWILDECSYKTGRNTRASIFKDDPIKETIMTNKLFNKLPYIFAVLVIFAIIAAVLVAEALHNSVQ